jgi:hypothetical protein
MGRRRKAVSEACDAPARAASQAPSPDPLVACVRTWIAERDAADALMDEWRRLESALIAKHGGMTTEEAVRRGHPEGRAMQDLERRCDALDRKLDRDALCIAKTRARTAEGVLAKIDLGLEIQSPFDRDECSWALIDGACEDLRGLIRGTRTDAFRSRNGA